MNPVITQALILIVGIVVYAVFIFKFYRFLAKRDVIKLHVDESMSKSQRFSRRIGYALENIVITPFLAMFWMLVLSALIMLLTRHTAETILLLSTGLVGGVRISSYISENLSQDLAKLVPFGFLAVFITEFDITELQGVSFPAFSAEMFQTVLIYLGLIVAMELIMRVSHGIFEHKKKEMEDDKIREKTMLKA